eukprot:1160747-Pelagomonas_calceolata.AAC.3
MPGLGCVELSWSHSGGCEVQQADDSVGHVQGSKGPQLRHTFHVVALQMQRGIFHVVALQKQRGIFHVVALQKQRGHALFQLKLWLTLECRSGYRLQKQRRPPVNMVEVVAESGVQEQRRPPVKIVEVVAES